MCFVVCGVRRWACTLFIAEEPQLTETRVTRRGMGIVVDDLQRSSAQVSTQGESPTKKYQGVASTLRIASQIPSSVVSESIS